MLGHTRLLAKLESDGRRSGRYERALTKLKGCPELRTAFEDMIAMCEADVTGEKDEMPILGDDDDADLEILPAILEEWTCKVTPKQARVKKAKAKAEGQKKTQKGPKAATTSTRHAFARPLCRVC